MAKATMSSRLDRKVTEFFSTKPKTGPRPDQPVYEISSSSEKHSVICVSSDDPSIRVSQPTRQFTSSSLRPPVGCSTAEYVPSFSGEARTSKEVPVASKPVYRSFTSTSSMAKKNTKKRKERSINLITSEESDSSVLPSIYVKTPQRKSHQREQKANCRPSIFDDHSNPYATLPLTPRQNILSPSKRPPQKPNATVVPTTSLPEPSTQQSQNGTPRTRTHHGPSPPKRARYNSISRPENPALSPPDCDADDESEDQVDASKRLNRKTPQSSQCGKQGPRVVDVMPLDNVPMEVDTAKSSSPCPVPVDSANKDGETGFPGSRPGRNMAPCKDSQVVLPSSQQNETELYMDNGAMDVHAMDISEPLSGPAQTLASSSKTRTDDIIARIKAKAVADAAAQAQEEHRRSSFGFQCSDESELSSLSSDSESDLELELSTFGKSNAAKSAHAPSTSCTHSQTPAEANTRRSTRHGDLPAPNYAKKLVLFRDDTPPPSTQNGKHRDDGKATQKGKEKATFSCPLDMLLKDHEREDARKARAETKRRANAPGTTDGHPTTKGSESPLDHIFNMFETPTRGRRSAETESPGSVSSPGSSEGALMSAAAREELLGKEGSEAVGKILKSDRDKKIKGEKKNHRHIDFWKTVTEGGNDVVPQLVTMDQNNPFLTTLGGVLHRGDHTMASLFLDSGGLTMVPLSMQLLEWLFSTAMSAADSTLSQSAYRAFLTLHSEVYSQDVVDRAQLTFPILLASLFKLGVNKRAAELLGAGVEAIVSVVKTNHEVKVELVCRFVTMLKALGYSQGVDTAAMPSIVSALLLLSLDPSAVPELQRDAISAIEAVLAGPNVTRVIELDVCKFIVLATTKLAFTPHHQTRLLSLLPGCNPSSGRVRRWVAWAMLGGDLQSVQECGDAPPIAVITDLFAKDSSSTVRLEVTRETDYEILGYRVEILSVAMTDIDGYVQQEQKPQDAGSNGKLESIFDALELMNGKIVDTRAAHLDRTRAKDVINRLHKRLVYQRHATRERLRCKTGNLDQFIVPKRSLTKPKPVKTHVEDQ